VARTPSAPRATESRLSKEVDDAFEGATVPAGETAGPGSMVSDQATQREVEQLFEGIAGHHTAQLREFICELTLSPTSPQWTDICAPSLEVLRRGAETITHDKLSKALSDFEKALDAARRGSSRIEGEARDQLLQRYRRLVKLAPKAFEVEAHQKRRDPIIVQTLLEQVEGVSSLAISQLYKAGVASLATLVDARPDEIAATTGLDQSLCERVVAHIAEYRRHRVEDADAAKLEAERGRLVALLRQVEDCQIAFRQAELDEDSGRKRRARNQRAALVREIRLALAHLGQLELIDEISRLPVEKKIERVDRWVRERARSA
jgi:hypothetical protein